MNAAIKKIQDAKDGCYKIHPPTWGDVQRERTEKKTAAVFAKNAAAREQSMKTLAAADAALDERLANVSATVAIVPTLPFQHSAALVTDCRRQQAMEDLKAKIAEAERQDAVAQENKRRQIKADEKAKKTAIRKKEMDRQIQQEQKG